MNNDFTIARGSDILRKPIWFLGLLLVMLALAYMIAQGGIVAGVGIIMIPAVLTTVSFIFKIPRVGLIVIYLLNYIILGLSRYVKGIPFGLSIDGILIMIYLALFFKSFFEKVPWKNAKNDLVVLAVVWYGYALFQLVNPEAVSRVAWFYAMRGVAFYMLLIIPIIFIVFNKRKDLDVFLKMWAVLALLGTLKGMMQKYIGVDPWEKAWLDGGGDLTHILFGKLRVFSFFSDAGQFGASQGHAGVVFGILALNRKKWDKIKILYGLVAVLGLYGMMISGTRGAIAVPIMGFALYTFLRKNVRIMILGALMGLSVLIFFKYTTIGSGNYTINRMRTAFDPNDKSLQVRLENQRKLKTYMASRPFGGGIGSAGNWGQRFTPNTFLANTPTDSWYVMIWAEQGIIGLTLHLFILFYVLGKSSYLIMFKLRDDWLKAKMMALASGMFGIMVASYGNGVLGQMPTGLLMYTSMAFLFLAPKLDKAIADEKALHERTKTT
ncbi:O-antigen ligase family protein [Marinifilum flexuosum]|uniref:O-antigen ligase family protein n=1 Tax=Marinifilum flexuosum TaxID=1117708 RepID=UPI002492FA0E|nr:O-antigen ligase family protein [Marinifilum flexuosum]